MFSLSRFRQFFSVPIFKAQSTSAQFVVYLVKPHQFFFYYKCAMTYFENTTEPNQFVKIVWEKYVTVNNATRWEVILFRSYNYHSKQFLPCHRRINLICTHRIDKYQLTGKIYYHALFLFCTLVADKRVENPYPITISTLFRSEMQRGFGYIFYKIQNSNESVWTR